MSEDELERLAKAARGGCWHNSANLLREITSLHNAHDAAFITAANPTAVLDLIAECRELRAVAEAAREVVDAPLREHLLIQFPELSEAREKLNAALSALDTPAPQERR